MAAVKCSSLSAVLAQYCPHSRRTMIPQQSSLDTQAQVRLACLLGNPKSVKLAMKITHHNRHVNFSHCNYHMTAHVWPITSYCKLQIYKTRYILTIKSKCINCLKVLPYTKAHAFACLFTPRWVNTCVCLQIFDVCLHGAVFKDLHCSPVNPRCLQHYPVMEMLNTTTGLANCPVRPHGAARGLTQTSTKRRGGNHIFE